MYINIYVCIHMYERYTAVWAKAAEIASTRPQSRAAWCCHNTRASEGHQDSEQLSSTTTITGLLLRNLHEVTITGIYIYIEINGVHNIVA